MIIKINKGFKISVCIKIYTIMCSHLVNWVNMMGYILKVYFYYKHILMSDCR